MKNIETLSVNINDLNQNFGNPRKISKQAIESVKKSIETFGYWKDIVVDEDMSVIAGNVRYLALKEMNIKIPIQIKKLVGYSTAEKKAINIKDNTHAGEFDFDVLFEWVNEIKIDIPEIILDFNMFQRKENEVIENGIKEKEVDFLETRNKCPGCGYEW